MIKRSIKYFSPILLFWMGFFTLDRILFLIYNLNESKFSLIEKIEPIWRSFRLDLATACYLIFPLFLIWVVGLFIPIRNIKKIFTIYFILFIPVLVFIIILNLEIYNQWGHQVNREAISYLKYPREAFASSLNSPLFLLLSIFLMVTFLFLWWGKYISELNYKMKKNSYVFNIKYITKNIFTASIGFILYGLCLRGGVQLAPINQSFSSYSTNTTLNAAAVNTVYNFLYSFTKKDHVNPYNYFLKDELDQLFNKQNQKLENSKKLLINPRPNIVLIVMEGISAELFRSMGGNTNLTPHMDKLIDNGLLFDNIYATSTRTDRGLVSILSGYPSLPKISLVKEPEKAAKLSFLSKQFKKEGYSTSFIYGGESEFANMKSYLLNAQFDKIIDKNNFNKRDMNSKWGAHDHVVFDKSFEELKRQKEPFFSTILTLSSHEPFEVPIKQVIKGQDRQSLYKNSVVYTDKSIGNFMRKVENEEYYNNTIFIFISDHGFRVSNAMNRGKRRYHIPLFLYGNPLKEAWLGKKVSRVGSQSDLAATILNQFNLNSDEFRFSNDLLLNNSGIAQYTFNHGFGLVSSEQSLIYDYDTEVVIYSNLKAAKSSKESFLNTGLGYLQKVYQDFIDRK